MRHLQCIDDFLDIAGHYAVKPIERQVYAMVGNAILRKVVCANFSGAVSGADHGFAAGGFCLFLFGNHGVQDFGTQHFHSV